MDNIEIPYLLVEILRYKLKKENLYKFVEDNDIPFNKKKDSIYTISINTINEINKRKGVNNENGEQLQQNFSNFLTDQLKYGQNRIVMTSFFGTNHNNVSDINNYSIDGHTSFNNILTTAPSTNFKLVEQEVSVNAKDVNEVTKANQLFVRIVHYSGRKEPSLQFVWIEIDILNNKVSIHVDAPKGRNMNDNLVSSPIDVYSYFQKEFLRKYQLTLDPSNEGSRIFSMYKNLTQRNEAKYLEQVNNYKDSIDNLVDNIQSELELDKQDDIKINIKNRIKNLFVRELIQKDISSDMYNFGSEASVIAFGFREDNGSNINASSGNFTRYENIERSIVNTSAYFDCKETIYNAGTLFSLTVNWHIGHGTLGDILVRYTAFNGLTMTHFLENPVEKEVYDNVFPNFERYGRNIRATTKVSK